MRKFVQFTSICILFNLAANKAVAQLHPMEALGRTIYDSFRQADFESFFRRSIFSMNEGEFKYFLKNIRNKSIRENLIALHKQDFPAHSSQLEKWEIAFEHQWRIELRHLAKYLPSKVQQNTFYPILQEAKEYGIKWETAKLLAIEVLLPATWKNGRFHIKGDLDLDSNESSARVLFLDRNLNYRITLNKLTYSKSLMIGTEAENSDEIFKPGILGNGSGQGDILIRFDSSTPSELFYFCPDQIGAGGTVKVKDLDDMDKPNQRTDLLLTFSYGQPARAYQILVKEVLISSRGAIFTERPKFLGEVALPRGLSFPY
jgi:hypothetical protein